MLKTKNEFLDHFARLGVFSKVQALMDDGSESESSIVAVIKSPIDDGNETLHVKQTQVPLATASSSSSGEPTATMSESKCKCLLFFISRTYCVLVLLLISLISFYFNQLMITRKTLKKFYREKPISGTNGAFVEAAIVCIFGRIQQHWNYRMARTDGFDSFWIANWQQCTRAEAPRMETTIQVRDGGLFHITTTALHMYNVYTLITPLFHMTLSN